MTCSGLATWKNADPNEQSLFGDEGTGITEIEKPIKALTNGREHAEDQKAVRALKVTYVHKILEDRISIMNL